MFKRHLFLNEYPCSLPTGFLRSVRLTLSLAWLLRMTWVSLSFSVEEGSVGGDRKGGNKKKYRTMKPRFALVT